MKIVSIALLMLLVVTTAGMAGELEKELLTMEKDGWNAWAEANGDYFLKNLTEDAVQIVAGTGVMVGREAIASEISKGGCDVKSYEFNEVKLHRLSKEVAMISYSATQDATCDGNKLPPKVLATSIYVMKDGKWMAASYQETPVE